MNPLLAALVAAGLVDPDDAQRIARQLDSSLARTDAEAELLQAFNVGLSTQRDRLIDAVRASDGLLSATQQSRLWAGENDLLWQSVRGSILDIASERATVATIQAGAVDMWSQVNDATVQYAESYYTSTAADNVGSIPNLNITSRQRVGPIIAEWQQGTLPASGIDGLPELIHNLQPIFGASRAKIIGVTETSRIFADSERQAAIANPFITHLLWLTSQDELVCPICGPLANQVVGKGEDGFQIPQGAGFPPAHVNCRCALSQLTGPALEALRADGTVRDGAEQEEAAPELPAVPAPVVVAPSAAPRDRAQELFSGDNYRTFGDSGLGGMNKYYKEWADSVTPEERGALIRYQEVSFGDINLHLRENVTASSSTLADIQSLDAMVARSSVPYNMHSYRGLKIGRELEVGEAFGDSGFVSTSLSHNAAANYAKVRDGEAIFEVRLKAGQPGAFVDSVTSKDEYEMLLPRDTNFTVISVREETWQNKTFKVYTAEIAPK